MGKVVLVVEQSNITELLLDSGAACRVRLCRVTAGYSCDAFLTATGAQTTFQGTLEVKSQRIDVHGEKITVTARSRLILVRRSIMSVCRPVGQLFQIFQIRHQNISFPQSPRDQFIPKKDPR